MLTRFRLYLITCAISAMLCVGVSNQAIDFNRSYSKLDMRIDVESQQFQIVEIGRTIEFRVIKDGRYECWLSIPF